jgi:hypothetical protein
MEVNCFTATVTRRLSGRDSEPWLAGSLSVAFLNCGNQSYRMIQISAFSLGRLLHFAQNIDVLTTTITAETSLPFMSLAQRFDIDCASVFGFWRFLG